MIPHALHVAGSAKRPITSKVRARMVMSSPTILFVPRQTLTDLRRENKEREPHFLAVTLLLRCCYTRRTIAHKAGGPLFAIAQDPCLH
jgi:hypothetical protein